MTGGTVARQTQRSRPTTRAGRTVIIAWALLLSGGAVTILPMTLANRLLVLPRGGYAPPAKLPPFDSSWARQGRVLAPTVGWESTSVQEPDVTFADAIFKMWGKGGWTTTGLGYYTSTDGRTWTASGSNPVLGTSPEIAQPAIYWDGTQYRVYYNSGGDSDPNTPRYATSPDGVTWTVQGAGTFVTNPGAITQWGNRHVWKEGASWYMLQEARSGGRWRMFYATSSDGNSWTLGNGSAALSTLELSGSHNVGGPTMMETPKVGSTYHLWFHTGTGSNSDLYHSTSTDRITWDTPNLVLTHSGTGDEVDQVADPSIVIVGSTAYLFYAGVDNTAQTGRILLLTAPAT